jgi:hypothetical protein
MEGSVRILFSGGVVGRMDLKADTTLIMENKQGFITRLNWPYLRASDAMISRPRVPPRCVKLANECDEPLDRF